MCVTKAETARESCANLARRMREEKQTPELSQDALTFLVGGYAKLVETLIDPRASDTGREFAYARVLGTRGNLCRLCGPDEMATLPLQTTRRWEWAETHLRDSLTDTPADWLAIARRVEDGWADSMERYVTTLASRLADTETSDKIGILKGIDTVGMHLAQRETFDLSQAFAVPLENAQAVKLRIRLLSLFLTLHRCGFCQAFPAIQSYRSTFRIFDPAAYPWWFVDCRLTERQLNWTHRRMPMDDLTWRF